MTETQIAGGVVVNQFGQVAITSQNSNSWSLPKGHIDEGEEPLDAPKREIEEETGIINITLVKDLGSYTRNRIGIAGEDDQSELKTIHMFLFKADKQNLTPKDPNNPEAKWIDKSEVASYLTHPKDKEFFLSIMGQI